eukprot:13143712-Alexandrium_andersonii.AAC.1
MEVDDGAAPSTPVGSPDEPASQGAAVPETGPAPTAEPRWGRRVKLSRRPTQAPQLSGTID